MSRRKYFWFAIVFLIIIFFSISIFQLFSRSSKENKTAVQIMSVPQDITLFVNDKKVSSSVLYLTPGDHIIKGEKKGFKGYEYRITTKEGQKNADTLFFVLSPESNEAKKWADKNKKAYSEIEAKAGEDAQISGESLVDKYPILKKIPYRSSLYDIDYKKLENSDEITVQITAATAISRQVAIERIRQWGYDPSDYLIEFRAYSNPFDPLKQEVGGE